MNTNISSSDADIDTVDSTLESVAKERANKGQNAELLKKYVEAHATVTNDTESNSINIDATDKNSIFSTQSQLEIENESQDIISYNDKQQVLATETLNDENVIVSSDTLGNSAAFDIDDMQPQVVKIDAINDKEILAAGLAKFNDLAAVAGVDDVNFDALMKKKRFSLFCKRTLDICGSFIGLTLLSPILILVALLIVCTSKGGIFYRQTRVGKNNKVFKIFKFRTMFKGSDKKGLALTTSCDCRITKVGKILRKLKIDELPQLINVFIGQMSFVGYRPEVPKYVDLYSEYQNNIQRMRPGITGLASIEYRNQDEVLAAADDVETVYIKDVMQKKLVLNMKYMLKCGFWYDIKLIFITLLAVFK